MTRLLALAFVTATLLSQTAEAASVGCPSYSGWLHAITIAPSTTLQAPVTIAKSGVPTTNTTMNLAFAAGALSATASGNGYCDATFVFGASGTDAAGKPWAVRFTSVSSITASGSTWLVQGTMEVTQAGVTRTNVSGSVAVRVTSATVVNLFSLVWTGPTQERYTLSLSNAAAANVNG